MSILMCEKIHKKKRCIYFEKETGTLKSDEGPLITGVISLFII
jgi:hypothetical protein